MHEWRPMCVVTPGPRMQNERVWGAVIDEESGRMAATAVESDGAFVLIGTCIAP